MNLELTFAEWKTFKRTARFVRHIRTQSLCLKAFQENSLVNLVYEGKVVGTAELKAVQSNVGNFGGSIGVYEGEEVVTTRRKHTKKMKTARTVLKTGVR